MRGYLSKALLVVSLAAALAIPAGAWAADTAPSADNMAADQTLKMNEPGEPNSIDPALANSVSEAQLVQAAFEGLVHTSSNGKGGTVAEPGVATSWDVSNDGLTWTFHLRQSTFSNGDPVTAQTFVYSWQRAVAPATASPYAYQLYYIKNAAAINAGKMDPATLGVKALDDQTLQVTLESPTPYFAFIAGFQTLFPVDPKVVEAHPKDWTLNPDTYVGNGPYKMVNWVHKQEIDYVKNPSFWDAKDVHLTNIKATLVEEPTTEYNMYETGQIDLTYQTPSQLSALLKNDKTYHVIPYLGTYFYVFNNKVKPFDNADVRKALSMAIDRQAITDRVLKQGQIPATAVVPPGLTDADGGDFRAEGGTYLSATADSESIAKAKTLLAKAGYPDGQGFPTVTITYNSSSVHKIIAEAIQQMWKKNLGINAELHEVEAKVWSQELNDRGGYQIMREGWIGDYPDPMTFLDMWTNESGNNSANFNNAEYDQLVAEAKTTSDQTRRMKDMHDAESILMNQAAVAPIYYYVLTWMQQPWVKDVPHLITGGVDFTHTWIAKH